MWALVENNEITKLINYPKPLTIGDVQYPSNIFQLWTKEQKENIGIYEVIIDDSNKRDEKYFINTNQQFKFENGVVTAYYDIGFDKQLDDTFWTQSDLDNGDLPEDKIVGDIKVKGLKTLEVEKIKQQSQNLLTPTDWHIIKKVEVPSYTIPTEVTDFRTNVRTKSNEMETSINNANDNSAFKTLFEYTKDENGVSSRPLPEFPKEVK